MLAGQAGFWVVLITTFLFAGRQRDGALSGRVARRFRWTDLPVGAVIGAATQLVLVPALYLPLGSLIDDDQLSRPARDLFDRLHGHRTDRHGSRRHRHRPDRGGALLPAVCSSAPCGRGGARFPRSRARRSCSVPRTSSRCNSPPSRPPGPSSRPLQRFRSRGDLGNDVDAITVVLHHLSDAADLAFDPPESAQKIILLNASCRSASHRRRRRRRSATARC